MKRDAGVLVVAVAAALLGAGCATPYDRVVSTGPDTFVMTSHGTHGRTTVGWATAGEQKVQIYEQATAYCQRAGKRFELLGERQTDLGWGRQAQVEVQFRCAGL